jgi:hypothetical protein
VVVKSDDKEKGRGKSETGLNGVVCRSLNNGIVNKTFIAVPINQRSQ